MTPKQLPEEIYVDSVSTSDPACGSSLVFQPGRMRWVGISSAPGGSFPALEVTMAASKAPESLGKAGKYAWTAVASKYELRADELRILEDACATIDMVAFLTEVWEREGKPILTKGSMGQEVIHPLIGELRAQRAQAARLVAQLKLPDDVPGAPVNQQRDAAASKWAVGKGRGA